MPPRLFSQTESNSAPSSHAQPPSEKGLLGHHDVEEESPTSKRERRPILLDFGDMSSEEEEKDRDKENAATSPFKAGIFSLKHESSIFRSFIQHCM